MSFQPGSIIRKDPDAELVYAFDWDRWLGDDAQIITSEFLITHDTEDPVLLTQDNDEIVSGGRRTQVRLLAGTVGESYTLTNRITTDENPDQTDDRSVTIQVRER